MKKSTEQYGKTVEEAIRKGLEELKVPRDEVKITVIDEPTNNGLLGMLSSKMAKVRLVVEKQIDSDILEATKNKVSELVNDIFNITKDASKHEEVIEDGKVVVKIDSGSSAHLIGYKGKTIEALQSTLNSILQKSQEEYAKVFVEVNDYKEKKEERLKELARRMASNAVKYKKSIKLEPMSAYERMIIHTELANSENVYTESVGEEPRRKVIIKLKNK